ncbi:MAG: hypothetical protein J6Y48_17100, partial [Clostridia bacterium]|nr:hypothetical protein [Clostridia bacterium]
PMLPLIGEDGKVRAVMDLRARAVCPLARQGKEALDPVFIDAVREAGELLAQHAEQVRFLERLREEQEELKNLRRKFMIQHTD